MVRAQKRDAVNAQKFFFRKDVFPPGVPSPLVTPLSTPHGSGANSPVEPNGAGGFLRKARRLNNCFAEVPQPQNGHAFGSVADEYDEYTLQEIFHGKVRPRVPFLCVMRCGGSSVRRDAYSPIHSQGCWDSCTRIWRPSTLSRRSCTGYMSTWIW